MNIRKARLHDSDTAKELSARDLKITRKEYIEYVRMSKGLTAEGHIYIGDRRVYAQG
jgi:hypothetical protein